MRRFLFLLTLALYGFSAMELHEWARVPQVLAHLLEHHSDFGHHHDDPAEHGHEDSEDHNPFGCENHASCCASSLVSLVPDPHTPSLIVPTSIRTLVPAEMAAALSAFSGSKWNPPRLA